MAVFMILVFIIGYVAIALEHKLNINKAASALVTGVLCWTIYIINQSNKESVADSLTYHLGDVSEILFFLLGAMTIVELIDVHAGFELITKKISTRSKRKLIWIICGITFFLSAILDNLTTTIVMVSLIRKILFDKNDRLLFCGAIVIAANAGGAWSPIGDVTTTMLWIGGQITAMNIIKVLILPSFVCLLLPLIILNFQLKGNVLADPNPGDDECKLPLFERRLVMITGILVLVLVPAFKTITHLPPVMGILIGLGILWIMVEIIHKDKSEEYHEKLTVARALRRIDTPSILFFLGILLAISALQSTGQLQTFADGVTNKIGNLPLIVLIFGLVSSIVDNVPLVAAAMGMYSINDYPADHYFWEFLAYCTGTGGSALIIGSAAGVAAMGIEKINFFWYLKRISWLAIIGYLAGAVVYLIKQGVW